MELMGLALSTVLLFTGLDDLVAHARMPKPTAEIKKLMIDLGDDEWEVREKANARLKELDYAALSALYAGLKDKDLEVRHRSRRTISYYFGVGYPKDTVPEMTRMPKEGFVVKYKQGGKNQKYTITRHQMVSAYMKLWHKAGREESYVWHDSDISSQVTRDFSHKMRLWGVPRDAIEKAMVELSKREVDTSDIVILPHMPNGVGLGPRGGMPGIAVAPNPVGVLGIAGGVGNIVNVLNKMFPPPQPAPAPKLAKPKKAK